MQTSVSPINVSRLRILPTFYSWLDHRLVRNHFLKRISPEASTMYLFLVTVGDRRGMSYYSDNAVYKLINISNIFVARQELIDTDLISYAKPMYQVLSLNTEKTLVAKKVNKNEVKVSNNEIPASKEEVSAILAKFREGLNEL